jgi:hypothetical protein
MTEIILSNGMKAIVDEADAHLFAGKTWHAWQHRNTWYARRLHCENGEQKLLLMHRVILSDAEEVDHRDGDGLNNRRTNLRATTTAKNHFNMRARTTGTSRFKGVAWYKRGKKWRAMISGGQYYQKTHVPKHLGYFTDEEDAARAYDAAAREYFGEFAALNFPRPGENSCHGRLPIDRSQAATNGIKVVT